MRANNGNTFLRLLRRKWRHLCTVRHDGISLKAWVNDNFASSCAVICHWDQGQVKIMCTALTWLADLTFFYLVFYQSFSQTKQLIGCKKQETTFTRRQQQQQQQQQQTRSIFFKATVQRWQYCFETGGEHIELYEICVDWYLVIINISLWQPS